MEYLIGDNNDHSTNCEWKGQASYWTIKVNNKELKNVGWSYPNPTKENEIIKDYIAFYARDLNCYVNDEKVIPQEGQFYGGWITSDIVGPFKGAADTMFW